MNRFSHCISTIAIYTTAKAVHKAVASLKNSVPANTNLTGNKIS